MCHEFPRVQDGFVDYESDSHSASGVVWVLRGHYFKILTEAFSDLHCFSLVKV